MIPNDDLEEIAEIRDITIEMTMFIKDRLEDLDEMAKKNVLCGVFVNTLFHEFENGDQIEEFLGRVLSDLCNLAEIIMEESDDE